MKIAILGGGHGCYAAAADLSEQGHEVHLWRRDAAALQPVVDTGCITLKDAQGTRDVRIALATADIGAAMQGAELIALHQRWNSFSAIVISLLGWLFVARSALALFAPGFLRDGADFILANPMALPIAGCVTALIGVWLSYAGYIAGTLRVETAGELGDPRR